MSHPSPDPRPTQHFRCELWAVDAILYMQRRDGVARAEIIRRLVETALTVEALNDPTIDAIVPEDSGSDHR